MNEAEINTPRVFYINKYTAKNEVTPWHNNPVGYQSFSVCTTINFSPKNCYVAVNIDQEKLDLAIASIEEVDTMMSSSFAFDLLRRRTTYVKDFLESLRSVK